MPDFESHATNLVDIVYGNETLRFDDPAENWFESSKIYRDSMPWDAPGVAGLLRSPALQQMTARAGKRFTNRPSIPLPIASMPTTALARVLQDRFSDDHFAAGTIPLPVVGGILEAGYGVIDRAYGLRRPVPSGGALYPLDLYVFARDIDGLSRGLYHFDPFRKLLLRLADFDDKKFLEATLREDALQNLAFSVVISATFWRSRFKYGSRAYRFALLEAGHVMQNMLLASTAFGIGSRPYGGFVDDELTELLVGQNGVDEAPLYMFMAGRRAA
ncbi:SagB/ThcOx family dehydrogenase [Leifsonia sp. 71-9]|uniref:SagB/ThcOx family dehydrogenase n=1 Tax=Leifsonia sp. 71-9 TaxID=1895934 RepID=UPI00092A0ED9|nr:SagB/ThcOx family dehydrogenase [Leifsonia sp. 71-9]OJX73041.1 MAG: dehydrogenase [Leifsonia sp. 71-9]